MDKFLALLPTLLNNNVKRSAALDSERENIRGTISQLINIKVFCKTLKTIDVKSLLI